MAIRMNESESLSRYNDHVNSMIEWYSMSRPATTTRERNFRVGVYDECLPLQYTHLWVLYGFICCSSRPASTRRYTLNRTGKCVVPGWLWQMSGLISNASCTHMDGILIKRIVVGRVGLLNECINKSLHGSSISHPRRMTKATHIPRIRSCWDVNVCRDEINGRHWHFVMDL